MSGLGRAFADADYGPYTGHPADPRTPEPDDDELTPDGARDQAQHEIMSTPAVVAQALLDMADPEWIPGYTGREFPGRDPHDARDLSARLADGQEPATLVVPELLTLAMLGDDASAMTALRELRERLAVYLSPEIAERADDLLREQVRMYERIR